MSVPIVTTLAYLTAIIAIGGFIVSSNKNLSKRIDNLYNLFVEFVTKDRKK
jgi:hypothetical protein